MKKLIKSQRFTFFPGYFGHVPTKAKKAKKKEAGEIPILLDGPYFTYRELEVAKHACKKSGRDWKEMKFTFSQRADLSGAPWQLLGMIDGK